MLALTLDPDVPLISLGVLRRRRFRGTASRRRRRDDPSPGPVPRAAAVLRQRTAEWRSARL